MMNIRTVIIQRLSNALLLILITALPFIFGLWGYFQSDSGQGNSSKLISEYFIELLFVPLSVSASAIFEANESTKVRQLSNTVGGQTIERLVYLNLIGLFIVAVTIVLLQIAPLDIRSSWLSEVFETIPNAPSVTLVAGAMVVTLNAVMLMLAVSVSRWSAET